MATDSGQRFIRRNRAPARAHHLRRSLRCRAAGRAPVRHGGDVRSFGQQFERRKARNRGAQVPRIRHGQFREPHGGDRAGRVVQGRQQARRRDRREAVRRSCASRRWTTSARPRSRGRSPRLRPTAGGARRSFPTCLRYMDGKVAAEDQIKELLEGSQADGRAARSRACAWHGRLRD